MDIGSVQIKVSIINGLVVVVYQNTNSSHHTMCDLKGHGGAAWATVPLRWWGFEVVGHLLNREKWYS
jgi:hypothetical protein